MKKKLTVNTLALGNLKARKKQYSLMIIGIVLAMTFSCGVLFFIFCMSTSISELRKSAVGSADVILFNAETSDVDAIKDKGLISEYGYAHILGYGYTQYEADGTEIARLDNKACELSYIQLIEGSLPTAAGEIAVEDDALVRLDMGDLKPGDTLKLTFKVQNKNEYLPETIQKSYKLVGILKNKRSNLEDHYFSDNMFPAAFVSEQEQIEAGGKEKLLCYYNYVNKASKKEFYKNFDLDGNVYNISSPDVAGAYAIGEKGVLASVLACVLMLASCMGIINAFNTNLLERKKQIGLLRAVGTTRIQIIKIFGREALIICLVSAPVSLFISYFSVRFITGLMDKNMIFIPSWWVFILCTAVSVVCVMLAALIPLLRASRISPMQAIRNTELSRKLKNKHIHSQKSFDASKLLAKRNLTFYRSRQVSISIVLVLTVVLTCFGFSYAKSIELSHFNYDYQLDGCTSHVVSIINNKPNMRCFSENDMQKILSCPYVLNADGYKSCRINILHDDSSNYLRMTEYNHSVRFGWADISDLSSENYKTSLIESEEYIGLKAKYGYTQELYVTELCAYEPSILEQMKDCVIEGKINIDKINSGEEVIVFTPGKIGLEIPTDKYGHSNIFSSTLKGDETEEGLAVYEEISDNDFFHAGDTINLSLLLSSEEEGSDELPDDCKRIDKAIKIGAVIASCDALSDMQIYLGGCQARVLTSIQGIKAYPCDVEYSTIGIRLKDDCTPEVEEEMQPFLRSITTGLQSSHISSEFEYVQSQKTEFRTLIISMISILILMFTVCASMINNSLTAQIRESKQKTGTLRAVGASAKEITRSYVLQLFSMFGWGCGIGFAIYCVIYLIAWILCRTYGYNMLGFNVLSALAICLLLFGICSLNLYIKVKEQMKYSIVENIREL